MDRVDHRHGDAGPRARAAVGLADVGAARFLERFDGALGVAGQFLAAATVVLIGTVLDVEDRKLTSKRFISRPEGVNAPPRCVVPAMAGLYRADLARDTISGVYIHAIERILDAMAFEFIHSVFFS